MTIRLARPGDILLAIEELEGQIRERQLAVQELLRQLTTRI